MRIGHFGTSISLNQVVLAQMVIQQEQGHDVISLCADDEWAEAIKERDIRVIDVRLARHNPLATLTAAVQLWNICRRERFDVLHTHNSLPGQAGRIAAWMARVPAVVHTCHAWPLHQPRSLLFSSVYRALETLAARAAHAVLFQNPDDMQKCIDSKVVPSNKATLIGNGINIEQLLARVSDDARHRVRQELGIGNSTFVIANVARLEPLKGHTFLLQGLKRLEEQVNREFVALFVGTGTHEREIRSQVNRLGLQSIVRFTGYRHDIPDLLKAADLSVLTSRFEGVPRALMESMALGLPVVATDVPGTRMLVESERTGLLVEYGDVEGLADALMRLVEDPELGTRLGENGKSAVTSEFDVHLVVGRIIQVYDHVLSGGNGGLPSRNGDGELIS